MSFDRFNMTDHILCKMTDSYQPFATKVLKSCQCGWLCLLTRPYSKLNQNDKCEIYYKLLKVIFEVPVGHLTKYLVGHLKLDPL